LIRLLNDQTLTFSFISLNVWRHFSAGKKRIKLRVLCILEIDYNTVGCMWTISNIFCRPLTRVKGIYYLSIENNETHKMLMRYITLIQKKSGGQKV